MASKPYLRTCIWKLEVFLTKFKSPIIFKNSPQKSSNILYKFSYITKKLNSPFPSISAATLLILNLVIFVNVAQPWNWSWSCTVEWNTMNAYFQLDATSRVSPSLCPFWDILYLWTSCKYPRILLRGEQVMWLVLYMYIWYNIESLGVGYHWLLFRVVYAPVLMNRAGAVQGT